MADGAFAISAAAPHRVSEADRVALAGAIDTDELVELALALGNIPSPAALSPRPSHDRSSIKLFVFYFN